MTSMTTLAPQPPVPALLRREPPQPAAPASPTGFTRMAIDCRLDYELDGDCDFVFMILPSLAGQTVHHEVLSLTPEIPWRLWEEASSGNRILRLRAPAGPLGITYQALVDRPVEPVDTAAPELPIADLPDDLLRFLSPTRYCESDHLAPAALQLFGAMATGHARVQAVADWVRRNIAYRIGSTTPLTTARDVFVQRAGVCRDFAHLSVAFCRALNIPARLVGGYARFPEPPPDFHAVFEAYLGGRWVMFDPTGMAPVEHLVRVATGSDAKDVAFATMFGPARMVGMSPEVTLIRDGAVPAA